MESYLFGIFGLFVGFMLGVYSVKWTLKKASELLKKATAMHEKSMERTAITTGALKMGSITILELTNEVKNLREQVKGLRK